MFFESETVENSSFPSYLDSLSKCQLNPLNLCQQSSETPLKESLECEKSPLNEDNHSINPELLDPLTEKQYENFSQALKKAASSLPTEDAWELLKKKIKKPKRMKVTKSSSRCKICSFGFRKDSIVHRFSCLHFCHEDCALFFKRISSKCPHCDSEKQSNLCKKNKK